MGEPDVKDTGLAAWICRHALGEFRLVGRDGRLELATVLRDIEGQHTIGVALSDVEANALAAVLIRHLAGRKVCGYARDLRCTTPCAGPLEELVYRDVHARERLREVVCEAHLGEAPLARLLLREITTAEVAGGPWSDEPSPPSTRAGRS